MEYQSFREVIDLWKSRTELADMLDIDPNNVGMMHRRDSVNAKYFDKIVAGAQAMGHADVTHELLCKLAARGETQAQSGGVS